MKVVMMVVKRAVMKADLMVARTVQKMVEMKAE